MGYKTEFNWYLVGNDNNMSLDIIDDGLGSGVLTKLEERFYPVGHRLPVVHATKGCLGMAIIDSVLVTRGKTRIEFTIVEELEYSVKEYFYNSWKETVERGHSSTPIED